MKIGIDAMGGDFAPVNVVKGAIEVYPQLKSNTKIVLFGDQTSIVEICKQNNFDAACFDIVPTSEVIEMGDHPSRAFVQKAKSSITVGFNYLRNKEIDGFASAGSTGAMMFGTMTTIGTINGVIRPCISSNVPLLNGKAALLVDVGLNVDCKPDVLLQYAVLGSIYAHEIMKYENPRVAIVNVGEEEEKGSLVVKAAHKLMAEDSRLNFAGNIEGHEFFTGEKADVIVCDGFVGNVILKQAESIHRISKKMGVDNKFFSRFNYELYGGTPILGVNSTVIIGHGASSPLAIKNMILQTEAMVEVNLVNKIQKAFE